MGKNSQVIKIYPLFWLEQLCSMSCIHCQKTNLPVYPSQAKPQDLLSLACLTYLNIMIFTYQNCKFYAIVLISPYFIGIHLSVI